MANNGEWRGHAIPSAHGLSNKLARAAWQIVYVLFFRPSPRTLHLWRRWVLRLFGARIGKGCVIHSSAIIWAPWNLTMGDFSAVGPGVDIYNVAQIKIGPYAVISQRATICTASHDYRRLDLPLTSSSIHIGEYVWICAEAFICPGRSIGDRAVVLARAFVDKDVLTNCVVGGHPARTVRQRTIGDDA